MVKTRTNCTFYIGDIEMKHAGYVWTTEEKNKYIGTKASIKGLSGDYTILDVFDDSTILLDNGRIEAYENLVFEYEAEEEWDYIIKKFEEQLNKMAAEGKEFLPDGQNILGYDFNNGED